MEDCSVRHMSMPNMSPFLDPMIPMSKRLLAGVKWCWSGVAERMLELLWTMRPVPVLQGMMANELAASGAEEKAPTLMVAPFW